MEKNDIFLGMSEQAIRERVVAEAVKWLGTKEGTIEHKKIVDGYNKGLPKKPRNHELQYNEAWCAAFITFIGISLGITDIILPECSCSKMIELYKAIGRWEERDDYVPAPGDIIMYDWEATSGECTGSPNHVGMVVSVSGKNIRVIEGNYGDAVKYRDTIVEWVKTRGFCLPNYASLVHGFSDVPAGAWYAEAVNAAAEAGIMEGVGGGLFEPERAVTRAELAQVVARLLER